jgi:hypothetical protein
MSYYLMQYGKTYGYGNLGPNKDGYIPGPSSGYASAFIASQFTSSFLNPDGSGVAYALSNGMQVLTDLNNGDGTSHAVIITGIVADPSGYGSSTGYATYTYFDPMLNLTGIVPSTQIDGSILMGIQH